MAVLGNAQSRQAVRMQGAEDKQVQLSCGNCKALRPFSGQPPACDECGWVCTPEAMRKLSALMTEEDGAAKAAAEWRERQEKQKDLGPLAGAIVGLFMIVLCLGVLYFLVRFVHWAWTH